MIACMEGFNYHHLHYFRVVAREGSIARASRQLRLAQPTISAQVHELEESLGQKLFARAGRGLALTETGQTVYGYAEQIFRLGNELVDAVNRRPAATPVLLRAGVDRTMASLIASRILKPALRAGGRASIVVREDTLERLAAQLALGALDLVLSDSPALPARIKLHAHGLGECPLSFFAPASEAAALKRRFPRSLDGAPLLLPGADSTLGRAIARWLEAERLRPVIVGEFDGSTLMQLFGQAGHGVFPLLRRWSGSCGSSAASP
jgi:LysR family transcriptional activator of nhaA